jgi:hypothetical protein
MQNIPYNKLKLKNFDKNPIKTFDVHQFHNN